MGPIVSRLHGLALAVQRNPRTGKVEPGSAVMVAPAFEGDLDDEEAAKELHMQVSTYAIQCYQAKPTGATKGNFASADARSYLCFWFLQVGLNGFARIYTIYVCRQNQPYSLPRTSTRML